MKAIIMKLRNINYIILLLSLTVLNSTNVFSQYTGKARAIPDCLGKQTSSDEVEWLVSNYKMKDDIPGVKAGKGITFYAPSGYVQRITFQNNKIYGSFKDELPFGLSLGMSLKDLENRFPGGKKTEDYYIFSSGKYHIEVKFTSPKMKKIEFIALT